MLWKFYYQSALDKMFDAEKEFAKSYGKIYGYAFYLICMKSVMMMVIYTLLV